MKEESFSENSVFMYKLNGVAYKKFVVFCMFCKYFHWLKLSFSSILCVLSYFCRNFTFLTVYEQKSEGDKFRSILNNTECNMTFTNFLSCCKFFSIIISSSIIIQIVLVSVIGTRSFYWAKLSGLVETETENSI
jgi:hypothetical protein